MASSNNNTDVNNKGLLKTYLIQRKGKKLKNEFSYTSDTNNDFLSVEQMVLSTLNFSSNPMIPKNLIEFLSATSATVIIASLGV